MVASIDIPSLREYASKHNTWLIQQGGKPSRGGPRTISVITVTFNCAQTLERTIKSVLEQNYSEIEYILVDGGSADETVDVIKRYADHLACWLSEPDQGISDAFNKGISLSSGDYIAIVNADDWLSPNNFLYAIETLEATQADFVFGDQIMWAPHDKAFCYVGDPNYSRLITKRMPAINHPTVIVRRAAYERYGLFSRDLRFAMDYELLLRFHCSGLQGRYDPRIVGNMSLSGASDRNYRKSLAECYAISRYHGLGARAALVEYAYSMLKGSSRRALQIMLPKPFLDRLWRIANRQFRPLSSERI